MLASSLPRGILIWINMRPIVVHHGSTCTLHIGWRARVASPLTSRDPNAVAGPKPRLCRIRQPRRSPCAKNFPGSRRIRYPEALRILFNSRHQIFFRK